MTQWRRAALGAKAALGLSICVGAAPLVATEKSSEASYLILSQSTQPKSSGSAQPKSPTQREGVKDATRATEGNVSRQAEISKGATIIWKESSRHVSTVKPQADVLSKFVDGGLRYNFPEKLDGLAISKDGNIVAGWRGVARCTVTASSCAI